MTACWAASICSLQIAHMQCLWCLPCWVPSMPASRISCCVCCATAPVPFVAPALTCTRLCAAAGQHMPSVTYVVSESFVVATKRVKHAIKSDIPSIGDHISKLVHIGKATVDKLQVRAALEARLEWLAGLQGGEGAGGACSAGCHKASRAQFGGCSWFEASPHLTAVGVAHMGACAACGD